MVSFTHGLVVLLFFIIDCFMISLTFLMLIYASLDTLFRWYAHREHCSHVITYVGILYPVAIIIARKLAMP